MNCVLVLRRWAKVFQVANVMFAYSQSVQQKYIRIEKVKRCQFTNLNKKCMCVHIVLKLFYGFKNSENKREKN